MDRLTLPCCLSLFVGLSALGAARSDDKATPLKQALALQELVQQTIDEVEPSVACILVSRSDAYARFGQGPASDNPGKLGAFDPAALDRHPFVQKLTDAERDRLRKKLDLAETSVIPEAFGSGVVLDEKGLVLTNYHVVRGATRVFVRLPHHAGSYADVLAADPRSDLAVLRLLHVPRPLRPMRLGDGAKAERGQFVLSVAYPFAAGFRDGKASASWGILSNVRRRAPHSLREEERTRTLHHYGTLLMTDARLNLGCSGGALVDLKGQMIGLTSSMAGVVGGETPGGFAVPIDAGMRRVIDILEKGEEVEYGFLGVGLDVRGGRGQGVVLDHVTPGSPADRAGLMPKHVILEVNGTPVHEGDDLFLALGTHMAGATVTLDVRKPGGPPREKVEVTLAKFHVPGKKVATVLTPRPFFRGLRVDYTSVLVQQQPTLIRRIPSGVVVSEVQPNTPAATALLKPGEVITDVAGKAVQTPAAFYQEVTGRTGPVEFTLTPSNPGQPAPKVTVN